MYMEQTEESIHVQFDHPLRTISNGVIGDGIQWSKHFCHYYIEKNSHNSHPEKTLQKVMQNDCIPFEQACRNDHFCQTGRDGDRHGGNRQYSNDGDRDDGRRRT